VAWTIIAVAFDQRSTINTEDLIIASLSGKAVFLQVSQIGKWIDFSKM
jgi:hypothetical protein